MAGWLIPALKAVAPHVGTIISAAKPVFTKKGDKPESDQALVQQQIEELQAAVSKNADNTRELAAQLQDTVRALEQAAKLAESRLRRALGLSLLAVGLSMVTLVIAIVA